MQKKQEILSSVGTCIAWIKLLRVLCGAGVFIPFLASQLSDHQETAGDSAFILPFVFSFRVYLYVASTVRKAKVISLECLPLGRKATWEA